MKYIRHKTMGFILFEKTETHLDVAKFVGGEGTIASAGFVNIDDDNVSCHGRSDSLDIGGRPDDTKTLQSRLSHYTG